MVRKSLQKQKQTKLQNERQKKKACRVLSECVQLVLDRVAKIDGREKPFEMLKQYYYEKLVSKIGEDRACMDKVIKIQRMVRLWLLKTQPELLENDDQVLQQIDDE